jgi:ribonuclease HII
MSLSLRYSKKHLEVGCDEAGRGCLAGPVFAAAVILPEDFYHPNLDDSKKLSEKHRDELRLIIEEKALYYAVASMNAAEIDKYNILWASVRTMHKAVDNLGINPEHILVDGNKFIPYHDIPHTCIVKGDSLYASIAAASVLAKTYRDEYMQNIHLEFPVYDWHQNKGYPTSKHRAAIILNGPCNYHRKSFRLYPLEKEG